MLVCGAGYAADKAKTPAKQQEQVINEGALTWLELLRRNFRRDSMTFGRH